MLEAYGMYLRISCIILVGIAIAAYASDGLDYRSTVIHRIGTTLQYAYLKLYIAVQYGIEYLRNRRSARCGDEISRYQPVSRRMADIRKREMQLEQLRECKGLSEIQVNRNRYKMKILK
ncbi:hypothetical protein [Ruminococcus gauvreauii]|uniref:hypothetical protein n=1 Tax=Ruminococcus gauvreauii TaxID=438033 RepID=UPI0039843DB3